VVARAAAASNVPLISAVGHETDTTLIDFVSDHRAPTPTAAAERAVPVRLELAAWLRDAEGRLGRILLSVLQQRQQRLRDLSRAMPTPDRLFENARQRLDRADRLGERLQTLLDRRRLWLAERTGRMSPQLLRGGLMARQNTLNTLALRLPVAAERAVSRASDHLLRAQHRLKPQDLLRDIEGGQKTLLRLSAQMRTQVQRRLTSETDRLAALERLRRTLGYEATLQRGYAVVRSQGALITSSKAAKSLSSLEIQFSDGRVQLGTSETRPAKTRTQATPPGQGSLF
jgi:exodeoxyribonuclease VII large subunit